MTQKRANFHWHIVDVYMVKWGSGKTSIPYTLYR